MAAAAVDLDPAAAHDDPRVLTTPAGWSLDVGHTWWYLARSSGFVAWVLLLTSLMMGTLISGRLTDRSGSRRWLLDLHPWVSGLAIGAVVLHVAAIVADSYVHISLRQALVPFASPWRPSAVAWGTIALWMLLVVQATSLVRNSLPKRVWHGIHLTSYLLAILATIHSILSGSDVGTGWGTLLIAGGVTVAVAASLQRAFGVGRLRRAERAASRGGIDLAERARARSGGQTDGPTPQLVDNRSEPGTERRDPTLEG